MSWLSGQNFDLLTKDGLLWYNVLRQLQTIYQMCVIFGPLFREKTCRG